MTRKFACLLTLWSSTLIAADLFVEVAADQGLLFQHSAGATGDFEMPEIMGSGVALLDYDGDGDLDVYLVQGAPAPDGTGDRLFRNLLAEKAELRFEDVTRASGLKAAPGHGMGVATGDVDNDGDMDLFISRFGPDQLLLNNGDGTFQAAPGDWDRSFGASVAFLDYDGDGLLDLFLTRYNGFSAAGNKECLGPGGVRDYCSPLEYPPLPDRLYRNVGKGQFRDVSAVAGVDRSFGNGLGVATADFNGDGRPDIYVANDKTPNQLWLNQTDGTFVDDALLAGAAYNADGMAEAGMGVTVGDYDGDGDFDLFLTHINGESNTLYRNDGGIFEDVSATAGLAHTSLAATGFGVQWFDFDNDGDLDLFAVNGDVRRRTGAARAFPYDQPNQLFTNTGAGFEDVSTSGGEALRQSGVSRGAAFGDVDNDGDIDIVINDADGPARLLLNRAAGERHWLRVRLLTKGRDAYGARAAVFRPGKKPLWRHVGTDGSYLSAGDPRLHFGLGDRPDAEALLVIWPDGSEQRFPIKGVDRQLTISQAP